MWLNGVGKNTLGLSKNELDLISFLLGSTEKELPSRFVDLIPRSILSTSIALEPCSFIVKLGFGPKSNKDVLLIILCVVS